MKLKNCLPILLLALAGSTAHASSVPADQPKASVWLKTPGNPAVEYPLDFREASPGTSVAMPAAEGQPLLVTRRVTETESGRRIDVTLCALQDVYLNYGERIATGFRHDDCQFYLPGFWYRRNLRSPKEAPSFHTSDSWLVREDRLSTPLTAVFNEKAGTTLSILRIIPAESCEALATHKEGEIILSGSTSLGYTGFLNEGGETQLAYGFPYREEPKTYIRKLTLAPPVKAFQLLRKGENLTLSWELAERKAADFSECVQRTWEYCYDTFRPQPVATPYSAERMKDVMSRYFESAYVEDKLTYFSGTELRTSTCASSDVAEVGFVGRTLLNAFNALEYAEANGRDGLAQKARNVFDSYLKDGFSDAGFFNEVVQCKRGYVERNHSIRRQSEGVYAMLHYLNYEKRQGRKHPEWESRMRRMLDMFLRLQNEDGSFPRKFHDDFSVADPSGGSTPSATLPLVMGYKYFKDKRYLDAAKRTVGYLEREIITKSDYFSSTLDANCEDKEASLYAATAAYYLALVSDNKHGERAHYTQLAKKAAYFALSWYYTWDVPFAPGQMLGDIGLQSRGWGNVSVENNHIDVFVFDFADVLRWLARECGEQRFEGFAEVISTSMRQLLPYPGHLCGIGKEGYYPEVVQHTNWDYGHNGKGYYNDIFAPGWTVASLWELLSPGRAEDFLMGKKK